MPWCPKCRNEYVEGVTTCIDCGVELVDELPEETNPEAPVSLYQIKDEQTGDKFVAFLRYGGLQTAGLLPEEDGTYQLVVAEFEREAAEKMFAEISSGSGDEPELSMDEQDVSDLLAAIEKQLDELEAEEASAMFSELRTEASSVYVKKKDKYTDLKFSGISFIVFGILGFGLLALNVLDIINLFNKFSTLIMALVFVIFIGVGVTSLLRARRLKNIVSEEEKTTDRVLDWVDKNITDERIAALFDAELSEEDNYFQVHSELCRIVSEEFPLFSKSYIDQLMDERYNDYCEGRQ